MDAMTIRAPVEEMMLNAAQELTDNAFEHFTQGDISRDQLKEFYGVVSNWSKVSERVLETMQKLGIQQ
jgi:hypothetical protein